MNITYSNSHLVFPKITLIVLGILVAGLVLQRFIRTKRAGTRFFGDGSFEFFVKDFDKVRFFGTFLGLFGMILIMIFAGFIPGGIIGISFLNILYTGFDKKNILVSIIIASIETLIVWFIFGQVFSITLP